MAEKEDPRAARATFAEAASAALNVPRDVIEAHLKLETGNGSKTIGGFNFGNIKAGKSWEGGVKSAAVPEYDSNGKAYTEGGAKFRDYKSPEEAGADYAALIQRRFPRAANAQTAEDYAKGLKAGGYATDPSYVEKFVQVAGKSASRPSAAPAASGSTFDRLMAEDSARQPASATIANVFDAYQSGRMDPQARSAFEADVKAGKMLLPRGASLAPAADGSAQTATAPTAGAKLPDAVWQAYQSGQMLPEHRAKLEQDVSAGLVAVPQSIKLQQTDAPGFFGQIKEQITGANRATPETQASPDWATMPELNSLSMAGMKTGLGTLMSSPDETVKVIQANNPGVTSRQDAKGNWFMTSPADGKEYAIKPGFQVSDIPRAGSALAAFTPAGRATSMLGAGAASAATQGVIEATQAATGGEFNGGEVATAGLTGALAPALGAAVKAGAPAVQNVVAKARGLPPVAAEVAGSAAGNAGQSALSKLIGLPESATTLPRRALDAVRSKMDDLAGVPKTPPQPTPGTMGSAGAAATDKAAERIATAETLGFTGESGLTAGQATRDAAQLKFEVESSKIPEAGAPLRQRVVKQNEQILKNFDDWIDKSGAEAPTPRAVGESVDNALVKQVARDKVQIRSAYKAAETAGEMEAPVTLDSIAQHLNESAPEAAVSPILSVAKARAKQLGIVAEDEAGNLAAQPVPLKTAELFRRSIGNATDFAPTNIRQSSIIKGLVDEATDGAGGQAYKAARALRAKFAQTYEDRAAVAKLVGTKRGMADRQVALEDVFTHSIIKSSADDITHLQGVMQKSGEEGAQAWKDLQGQTMQWIKDEASKNVAANSAGERVVSPAALDKAVRSLDTDGRLDIVLGKQGAARMRDIRDLALYMKTVPPEAAINTSNTASTLLQGFIDAGITGSITGIPVPVMTAWRAAKTYIADRALAARIEAALTRKAADAPKKGF